MAQSPTPVPTQLTVIFDGTCGFCTRWIRYMHKADRQNRLTSVPCQELVGDTRYGLRSEDCLASVWAYDGTGNRAAGAQAATLIVSTLLQKRWPVTIGKLPGIRHALAGGYRVIANNRYRFPGDTPPYDGGTCGRMPSQ